MTNTTTPSNPPYLWMGEPTQRGTFGIISFCLSTLIICIWSTLHFNIPTRRFSTTRCFFFQVAWMIVALLAPELLLYYAINERITAGVLLKKVLEFHPHLAKPRMLTHVYNWICGQGVHNWIQKDVSTQCQASRDLSTHCDRAETVWSHRAAVSTSLQPGSCILRDCYELIFQGLISSSMINS